eukprot:CAMPEP_0198290076 /NCGR_PEP_ID=MMETSP1449-20131203/8057_1 /TAXON_ID=420275 /ORGANISM="Attheya septentrionalis, Strain CCMP2084" /LENGTH=232 /DNA_ID=CAMNT_0043988511 /DNA_START=157 /DNA_END=855 /DNA_ORIENTATION=+
MAVTDEIYGSLETAIIQASDATYPVLKALTPETTGPLANKIAKLLTSKVPAEKLATALDSTADTLLSIPDDKLAKFVATVKTSYQDISSDSCQSIPFPADAANVVLGSEAVSKLSSEKVQQVAGKIAPLVSAVPASTGGICLPSKEGLEQVWIGQTQLVLSIPTPIKQQLAANIAPAAKSIPSAELLRLLPDAKKALLGGVDRKEGFKFQDAGVALDKALKQDYRFKSFQTN